MTGLSNEEKEFSLFYRRRLPHWQLAEATIFVTWRLYGSLPVEALERLATEQHLLEKQAVRPEETPRDRALRHGKRLFAVADEMLAGNDQGPQWLKDERIAQLVVNALFHHDGKLYMLLSFVVMPNHVHVLLRPLQEGMDPLVGDQAEDTAQAQDQEQAGKPAPQYVPLRRITQSLKGYTAREANRLLQRTGLTFWQDESYDHWARDESEIERIALYIESDPVRAGLTTSPEQWRWSSAWEREWGRLRESRADSTVCPEAS